MGIADGGKAVRDHEAGSARKEFFQGVLDDSFGLGIHGASRFVQDAKKKKKKNKKNKRQQLTLAGAEIAPALADLRGIAFFEALNELMRAERARSFHHFFIARLGPS